MKDIIISFNKGILWNSYKTATENHILIRSLNQMGNEILPQESNNHNLHWMYGYLDFHFLQQPTFLV